MSGSVQDWHQDVLNAVMCENVANEENQNIINFTNIIPAVKGEVENPLSETGFRFRKWNYDNQTIVKS